MKVTYDPGVVILSFGIAFTGSYLAISLCEQYRQCRLKNVPSKLFSPLGYLIVMSICLGGVGIWCMHFIGMSAMIMYYTSGERMETRYHIGYTILSLILVICFSFLGFYISSHDDIFMKSKKEILKSIVQDASFYSIAEAKHITPLQMTWIIGTHSPKYLIYGGLCTGSGVIIMHYVGMVAMKFHGHVHWNAGIIAASCFIAILAATAAFWILFRFLSVYAQHEYLRIISAFIMAIAVCGMHYVGMIAGRYELDNTVRFNYQETISPRDAFLSGIIMLGIISLIGSIILLCDLRHTVHKLSYELGRADETIMNLPVQTNTTPFHLIQRYLKKRKHTRVQLDIINQTRVFEEYDDEDLASSEASIDRRYSGSNNNGTDTGDSNIGINPGIHNTGTISPPIYTVDIESPDISHHNNHSNNSTSDTNTLALQIVQKKPKFVPSPIPLRFSFLSSSTITASTACNTTDSIAPSAAMTSPYQGLTQDEEP